MVRAKTLFDAKKFDAALEELQRSPKDDPLYYYNLGTIYYHLGRNGNALAYLEKANHLKPHDGDIQHNLALARIKLTQTLDLDPSSYWFEAMADRISTDGLKLGTGFLALTSILLLFNTYLKIRNQRPSLKFLFQRPAAWLSITGFFLTATFFGLQRWVETHPAAVCLNSSEIRSGPGSTYLKLSEAPAGTKLRILHTPNGSENREQWAQIRYQTGESGGIGWVKASDLLTVY